MHRRRAKLEERRRRRASEVGNQLQFHGALLCNINLDIFDGACQALELATEVPVSQILFKIGVLYNEVYMKFMWHVYLEKWKNVRFSETFI